MYHPPAFEPTRDEMMSILEKHIPFLNRMELVPIWEADGRTVSEDLTAPYSLPGQDASACDGIAVRFADFAAGLRIRPTGQKVGSLFTATQALRFPKNSTR